MTDLSDFQRIVHEPQVRALREKHRELRASLEAAEARVAELEAALREAEQSFRTIAAALAGDWGGA